MDPLLRYISTVMNNELEEVTNLMFCRGRIRRLYFIFNFFDLSSVIIFLLEAILPAYSMKSIVRCEQYYNFLASKCSMLYFTSLYTLYQELNANTKRKLLY